MTVETVADGTPIETDWGNAVANDLNAVTATAAGKVSKAGDTMTGNLATPRVNLDSVQPTLLFNETDSVVDARKWRLAVAGGVLYLQMMNDAETVVAVTPITVSRAGAISLNQAGVTVTVPAISGANQAAQVTAYNATTGQLAIGGREIGDTGWRNITSLQTNGWAWGQIQMRRRGSICFLRLDDGGSTSVAQAATNSTIATLPAGFRPNTTIHERCLFHSIPAGAVAVYSGFINGTSGVLSGGGGMMGLVTRFSMAHVYATSDAWPTSLPGSMMLPADVDDG